jgi:hypothetical protein
LRVKNKAKRIDERTQQLMVFFLSSYMRFFSQRLSNV